MFLTALTGVTVRVFCNTRAGLDKVERKGLDRPGSKMGQKLVCLTILPLPFSSSSPCH